MTGGVRRLINIGFTIKILQFVLCFEDLSFILFDVFQMHLVESYVKEKFEIHSKGDVFWKAMLTCIAGMFRSNSNLNRLPRYYISKK